MFNIFLFFCNGIILLIVELVKWILLLRGLVILSIVFFNVLVVIIVFL